MFSGHPHSAPLESSNSSEQTKQEIASFTSTLLDTPSLSPWNLLRVKHILAHVDQEGGYGGGALDEEDAVWWSFSNIFTRSHHPNIALCRFLYATLTK